jgi:aspartokinase/homoserine dehydrogenase 1
MKVLKFGGTSVGTVESLRNVKSIVENQTDKCVVVVSALGGVTDMLLDTARRASSGDATFSQRMQEIVARHDAVIEGVVPQSCRAEVAAKVTELLRQLSTLYQAIALLGEATPRSLDLIVSYGERMSSVVVSAMIEGSELKDSRDFIRTVNHYGSHVLDAAATSQLVAEHFASSEARVTVVPGFIATDGAGTNTNLGRGGSDYTAAILAAELGADILEIWTDVDGFMTADPRVVKSARVIDSLSFVEAMELCNFGAKVVYPPTIYPVFHHNIPIVIKNTFNPAAPGTLISDSHVGGEGTPRFSGVTALKSTALVTLRAAQRGVQPDAQRVLNALSRAGVSVILASSAGSLGVRQADAKRAVAALSDEFAEELTDGRIAGIDVKSDLATLAVVGLRLKQADALAADISGLLIEAGLPLLASARQASAETTVACIIAEESTGEALNLVHNHIFHS